jgi:hypothetical protein
VLGPPAIGLCEPWSGQLPFELVALIAMPQCLPVESLTKRLKGQAWQRSADVSSMTSIPTKTWQEGPFEEEEQ